MADSPTIVFDNVSKTYKGENGQVKAMQGINISLNPGQFVAVQGPSGCGKSTLLLVAGTLLRPDSGTVRIANQRPYDLTSEARAKFRAKEIGFVFQQFHLIPYLTVRENILTGGHGTNPTESTKRADALIEELGLTHRTQHTPANLSTGERQRTALARAMLNNPKLILADEPTGNLDEENTNIVMNVLRQFANSGGTVIMVTHDAQAAHDADSIIKMKDGLIVE